MKKTELLEVLESQLIKQNNTLKQFENDNNPQIKELYNIALGSKDILEATIYFIKTGSKLYF